MRPDYRQVLADLSPKALEFLSTLIARCRSNYLARRRDHWIGLLLGLMGWFGSFFVSGLVDPSLYSVEAYDVWFDADIPRVFDNMVSRLSNNSRADVHPFFALLAFVPLAVLRALFRLDNETSVRALVACSASAWIVLMYALLRCMSLRWSHALLFTVLAAASSASMFWFVVPETMSFGAVTILAGLIFAVAAPRRGVSTLAGIAINIATLSVTATNWIVGLAATAMTYSWRQTVRVIALTVLVAVVLSAVQLRFFPRALPFGASSGIIKEQTNWFFRGDSGGMKSSIKALVFHSMVMPRIQYVDPYWVWNTRQLMRVQLSRIGSGTGWGIVAVLIWCALMGIGIWSFLTVPVLFSFRVVLSAVILFELCFFAVFGREAFLFSLFFTPLLVLVAAFGTFTAASGVTLALALSLLVTAGINNGLLLREALAFTRTSAPPGIPLSAGTEISCPARGRSEAPASSIILSNRNKDEVGAVGPGGTFTTGDQSLAVSLWVARKDAVIASSDTHWSPITTQRVIWPPPPGEPSIETNNWYYQVTQRQAGSKWTVEIEQQDNLVSRLIVAVRSTGRIVSADGGLIMDDRWTVRMAPAPAAVHLVGANEQPATSVKSSAGSCPHALAILELDQRVHAWQVLITKSEEAGPRPKPDAAR